MSEQKKETNVYERLFKLWSTICKMVVDGVRDPEKVADVLQAIVDEPVAMAKKYLRRLFGTETITVGVTDGTEKFSGSDLFGDRVYGVTLPDVAVKSTPAMHVMIHEIVENATFAEFFGSLGEKRFRWQNMGQILNFCRDHRDKLRTDGYATFFELEGGFFAFVFVDVNGRLVVRVDPFSFGLVWRAEYRHRLVSPQL